MILDSHIHIADGPDTPEEFHQKMASGGISGGIIISRPPSAFRAIAQPWPNEKRLKHVFTYTESQPHCYPFYWVDPLEDDAVEQVNAAAAAGVAGFKIICDRFYISDEPAMATACAIAATGKPVLFHSGILWDGKASSRYNRPAEFEALLDVADIRFALAHISWPWYDECIAVYGKFLTSRRRRPEVSAEMFIDTTPGTPLIYRRDALTKLFTVGYNVHSNVMFGSDQRATSYDPDTVNLWLERDRPILSDIEPDPAAWEPLYSRNLLRFVGADQRSSA